MSCVFPLWKKVSHEFLGDTKDLTDSVTVEFITIGIPREPWDFVKQAAIVGHPRFLPYAGTQQMNELVSANLNLDTGGLLSSKLAYRVFQQVAQESPRPGGRRKKTA